MWYFFHYYKLGYRYDLWVWILIASVLLKIYMFPYINLFINHYIHFTINVVHIRLYSVSYEPCFQRMVLIFIFTFVLSVHRFTGFEYPFWYLQTILFLIPNMLHGVQLNFKILRRCKIAKFIFSVHLCKSWIKTSSEAFEEKRFKLFNLRI